MHHSRKRILSDGDLTRALRRIRRRLAERPWEIDASGRIRCTLLPSVEGYPARVCCPLGMLAAEAPRTRLERALDEPANAEWKAVVQTFVELEVRGHARALRERPAPSADEPYAESDLLRLGVGLTVSTAPSAPASESILAMERATIQVLSDATDHPHSDAGILLTRCLSTESNALAEDFQERFRQTVADAAAASRAAIQRRLRELSDDVHGEGNGTARAPAAKPAGQAPGAVARGMQRLRRFRLAAGTQIGNGIRFVARVPATAIDFGVDLWKGLGWPSAATHRPLAPRSRFTTLLPRSSDRTTARQETPSGIVAKQLARRVGPDS